LRDLSDTWIIATEGMYDQVKPLKIFDQINFPKAPLVRRRLHRPTHAHHRRSGRTNIQENDDSKEKSLHNLRYTKKVPPNHIRFVLCFFVPLCSSCCTLQDAWVERYLSQGGLILKHD